MRKRIKEQLIILTLLLSLFGLSFAKEVSFTQEDRERIIRLDVTIKEFKDAVDKRFEQVDKRFEQVDKRFEQLNNFLYLLSGIFTALVGVVIALALWDRRTMLREAKRETREYLERESPLKSILEALKELAKEDSKVAEILKKYNLL
ncbi:MAG: hypothetical protein RMJ39_06160 [Deltaproteobacteria bacterium]|nr:hypothetical protein [Deltaproteobacteria bacterium]